MLKSNLSTACRLLVCGFIMALIAGCGGSGDDTSTGSSGAGATSSGSDPTTSADSAANTGATTDAVTAPATSINSAAQGQSNLIKARVAALYTSRSSRPQNVSSSGTMPETSSNCTDGGAYSYGGTYTYDIDDTSYAISMVGDLDLGFDACAESYDVEASDGTCTLEVVIDGDLGVDFVLDMPNEVSYSFDMDLATSSDMSVDVNGESHTVAMAMTFTMDESNTEGTLTGTVTVDGDVYDAADVDNIVYSDYTMEDLGC